MSNTGEGEGLGWISGGKDTSVKSSTWFAILVKAGPSHENAHKKEDTLER